MIKEIIQDFKEWNEWFKSYIFYRRQSVKMSLAIKLADVKQKAYNKQFHIMLLSLPVGEKLVSINRDDIECLKRKKWLPKETNFFNLKHSHSIFYSTPLNRNNKLNAEERREAVKKYLKYSKRYVKN